VRCAGVLGVYIVLRGMSYIGHGLSHAIFGGAVVAYVMQWNFYLGAGLWGLPDSSADQPDGAAHAHRC
jgi:ABC-type Mn2+/Zn2+ transport system permease subunit